MVSPADAADSDNVAEKDSSSSPDSNAAVVTTSSVVSLDGSVKVKIILDGDCDDGSGQEALAGPEQALGSGPDSHRPRTVNGANGDSVSNDRNVVNATNGDSVSNDHNVVNATNGDSVSNDHNVVYAINGDSVSNDHNVPAETNSKGLGKRKRKRFECGYCQHRSALRSRMLQHLSRSHADAAEVSYSQLVDCGQCDFQAASEAALDHHVSTLHNNRPRRPFSCVRCEFTSAVSIEVELHMLKEHPEAEHKCALCDFKAMRRIDVDKHVALRHGEKQKDPAMSTLGRSRRAATNRKSDLERKVELLYGSDASLQAGTGGKPFSCGTCGLVSFSRLEIVQHSLRDHASVHPNPTTESAQGATHVVQCKDTGPNTRLSHLKVSEEDLTAETLWCALCSYRTDSHLRLKRHFARKHNRRNRHFCCDKCSFSSPVKASVEKHMLEAHPVGFEKACCALCGFTATRKTDVDKHMIESHPATDTHEMDIREDHVDLSFKNISSSHNETSSVFACNLCKYRSALEPRIRLHIEICHAGSSGADYRQTAVKVFHSCVFCDFRTISESRLEKHVAAVHVVGVTGGVGVGAAADVNGSMQDTESATAGRASFYCDECDFSTDLRIRLKRHVAKAHDSSYEDDENNGSSGSGDPSSKPSDATAGSDSSSSLLPASIASFHAAEMKSCELCQFRCPVEEELERHTNMHHFGLRPCAHCSFQTSEDSCLEKHLRLKHPGQKIHLCPYARCGFVSALRDDVLAHVEAAHSHAQEMERTYLKCNKCGFRTHDAAQLSLHFLKEHSLKYLKCPKCIFRSHDPVLLSLHTRTYHSTEPEVVNRAKQWEAVASASPVFFLVPKAGLPVAASCVGGVKSEVMEMELLEESSEEVDVTEHAPEVDGIKVEFTEIDQLDGATDIAEESAEEDDVTFNDFRHSESEVEATEKEQLEEIKTVEATNHGGTTDIAQLDGASESQDESEEVDVEITPPGIEPEAESGSLEYARVNDNTEFSDDDSEAGGFSEILNVDVATDCPESDDDAPGKSAESMPSAAVGHDRVEEPVVIEECQTVEIAPVAVLDNCEVEDEATALSRGRANDPDAGHFTEKSANKYTCLTCDFQVFSDVGAIRTHVIDSHAGDMHTRMEGDTMVVEDTIVRSSVPTYGCGRCLRTSRDGDKMAEHVRRCRRVHSSLRQGTTTAARGPATMTFKPTDVFTCGRIDCEFQTMVKKQILRHIRKHHGPQYLIRHCHMYSCVHCQFSTTVLVEMRRHLNNTHLGQSSSTQGNGRAENPDVEHDPLQRPRSPPVIKMKLPRFTCRLCPFESTEYAGIKRHIVEKHDGSDDSDGIETASAATKAKPVTVIESDLSVRRSSYVQAEETMAKVFKCAHCDFMSLDEKIVQTHLKAEHSEISSLNRTGESSSTEASWSVSSLIVSKLPGESPAGPESQSAPDTMVVLKYSCRRCPFHTFDKADAIHHDILAHSECAIETSSSSTTVEIPLPTVKQFKRSSSPGEEHAEIKKIKLVYKCRHCPVHAFDKQEIDRHIRQVHRDRLNTD